MLWKFIDFLSWFYIYPFLPFFHEVMIFLGFLIFVSSFLNQFYFQNKYFY